MTEKLKPCPLCGRRSHATKLAQTGGKNLYNVSCGHPRENDAADRFGCGLVLFGDGESLAEMKRRWNTRQDAKPN